MFGGGRGQDRQPCGACKHLRQQCGQACIFAPFFPANAETRFARAIETYSVEKMTALIVAFNNGINSQSNADSTVEARYHLLWQLFRFFHHLRLLVFEDKIRSALQAAQASSSSSSSSSSVAGNQPNIAKSEADRLVTLPPCVVCEQRGIICGNGCIYAIYFPVTDVNAERNLARVERKYGMSVMTDLIKRLNPSMAADGQRAASVEILNRMLEFVDFLKQLYLENGDALEAEASSSGASNHENVNTEPTD